MSDSVLYVYAIADAAPAAGAHGLFGAPLRAVRRGALLAVVSEHERAPEPAEDLLWAHERVVEELLDTATVLPLRFGSTVASEAEAGDFLERRAEEFGAALEAVRGAVELSVRARLPAAAERPDPPPEPPSGTTYLLERARAQRRQLDDAERIHAPLAALARRSAAQPGGLDPAAFKAAYLVDRAAVPAFAAKVGELNETVQGVQVSCTGPWPPYSFVAGGERG